MKKTSNQLKQWLFNKPAVFTLLSFIFISVFILIYSLIASWLNINHEQNLLFGLVLFLLPFIYFFRHFYNTNLSIYIFDELL